MKHYWNAIRKRWQQAEQISLFLVCMALLAMAFIP